MEEEEISKFKALILEKLEDLLALGEDLAYQLYTIFYDKSHELEVPSKNYPPLKTQAKQDPGISQTSINFMS